MSLRFDALLISKKGHTDAFNFALAAWDSDPHHYFDRTFQPLLNPLAT
jgi:hypothetical protein